MRLYEFADAASQLSSAFHTVNEPEEQERTEDRARLMYADALADSGAAVWSSCVPCL